MAKPMTGYTKCPKCGLTIYVWKDEGTCYVCGKVRVIRGAKKSSPKEN